MEEHQTDYSKITNQIYIGSDLCKGPWCPVHSDIFKQLGVCGEINLEMERDEHPSPGVDAYIWLPTPDKRAPTEDQLMIGSAVIKQMIDLGNVVYVHCRNGHGRSPTMVAAYFVRYENKSVDEAVSVIVERRPEVHLEEAQLEALRAFEKKCK